MKKPRKLKRGDTVRFIDEPARIIAVSERSNGAVYVKLITATGVIHSVVYSVLSKLGSPARKGDAVKLTKALAKL